MKNDIVKVNFKLIMIMQNQIKEYTLNQNNYGKDNN